MFFERKKNFILYAIIAFFLAKSSYGWMKLITQMNDIVLHGGKKKELQGWNFTTWIKIDLKNEIEHQR